MRVKNVIFVGVFLTLFSCSKDSTEAYVDVDSYPNVTATFGTKINLNSLYNYANQAVPSYITKFNGTTNPITDKGATLGRVLFYDKKLSSNNTVACASCHQQQFAFSDQAIASTGVNGTTGRHSMRLINARFANESKFFWDERAASLEVQTTMPIKDHAEMGFSGANGDQDFNALITKLSAIGYYKELFKFVYGSEEITETKIQLALAQFIRSIQSFDSKYDVGRAQVANDVDPFPNFSQQENLGKQLFISHPVFDANSSRIGGGLGCGSCHAAPEFDIDPNSRSNGFGGSLAGGPDFTNTRAPSLRDLVKTDSSVNTPMMHTAVITTLQAAIGHYGNLTQAAINNSNLDPSLKPNGIGQQLNLNQTDINSVIAFLKTLSGTNVYTDPKWSTPF